MKRNKSLVPAGQRQKNSLVKKIAVMLVTLAMVSSISCGCSSSASGNGSGQINGQVHLEFPNGGQYKGNLQNGQRSGQGTFTWADGSTYDGSWIADRMQGKGTFTGPDGTQWTGTFSDNAFQNGTTYHVTGKSFSGTVTVAANVNQAKLTFTCPDPYHLFQTITITYTGDLTKDGKLSGSGTIRYPNGDTYTGTVSSGKKTGGTYTFRNGDRYVGTFSGDRMCDGTYTFSTGQTLKGHFERGIPSGKMIYTAYGIAYNTTWSNGTCVGITLA